MNRSALSPLLILLLAGQVCLLVIPEMAAAGGGGFIARGNGIVRITGTGQLELDSQGFLLVSAGAEVFFLGLDLPFLTS